MPAVKALSRSERKEIRHAEIIEAAFQEFAAKGYDAARLDDVADRVGVTKGSLYLYFDSKEELFRAVVRRYTTQSIVDASKSVVGTGQSAAADLRAVLRTFYEHQVNDPHARELVRLIIAGRGQFPELIAFYHSEMLERCFAGIRQTLEAGIARGEFRDVPTDNFVLVAWAPVLNAVIWQIVYARHYPLDMEKYFDMHCDLLLNGLCVKAR